MSGKAPVQMTRAELLEYIYDNLYPEEERLREELADANAKIRKLADTVLYERRQAQRLEGRM